MRGSIDETEGGNHTKVVVGGKAHRCRPALGNSRVDRQGNSQAARDDRATEGEEMKVTAHAVRSGDWWSVDVPEVDGLFTQARRLDRIPAMVADAGELLTDIPAAEFEVILDYDFDPAARREIEEVKQLNAAAQRAVDEASRQSRAVVHDLRQRGLSVREIGVMLGITPSRVSQLGKDKDKATA